MTMQNSRAYSKTAAYIRRAWPLYVMLIPGIILLLIFNYYPMYGLRIAFQDYHPVRGFERSPWVGLKHFEYLLKTPTIKTLVRNTLVIAISKIVSGNLASIALALLLNEVRVRWFKRVASQLFYLLHFLSWIILGGILLDMLAANGLVGRALNALGVNPFMFLGDAKMFRFTVIVTHLWKEVGWGSIIYLAALAGIDPTYYEAAAVDGAGRWQRLRHITLPGIAPTVFLIATLSLGSILDAGFEQVLTLYNPGVYSTGDILDTYIYRAGLISARFSLATAVGLFRSTVGLVLISLAYWLAAKFSNYHVI